MLINGVLKLINHKVRLIKGTFMKNRVLFLLGIVCVLYTSLLGNGFQCLASTSEPLLEVSSGYNFPSSFYENNAAAYSDVGWYTTRNDGESLAGDDSNLHIFAFNVEQGNCIILRKKNEVVIIDAGYGKKHLKDIRSVILPKIQAVLNSTVLKAIFITHPHDDHHTIIPELLESSNSFTHPTINDETKVFLGGPASSWSKSVETSLGKLKKKLKGTDRYYIASGVPKCNEIAHHLPNTDRNSEEEVDTLKKNLSQPFKDILSDVEFNIFLPEGKLEQEEVKGINPLSLIIKATYNGQSLLFTGDAEGGNFYRLKTRHEELAKDAKVVFLPHHGTDTEGSDRWVKYLSLFSGPNKLTWFISSSPEGLDSLPKCSIIKKFPFANDSNKPHDFSCKSDGDGIMSQSTRAPRYITGAAPGGVYWLRIPNNENKIELYNANKKKEESVNGEEGWEELSKQTSLKRAHPSYSDSFPLVKPRQPQKRPPPNPIQDWSREN